MNSFFASVKSGYGLILLAGLFLVGAGPLSGTEGEPLLLVSPATSANSYVVGVDAGSRQAIWSGWPAGGSSHLLPDGGLLRMAGDRPQGPFVATGLMGGRLMRISPEGKVVWNHWRNSATQRVHHDALPLPDGGILALVWEHRSPEDCAELGLTGPEISAGGLLFDGLLELRPAGEQGARVSGGWSSYETLMAHRGNNLGSPGSSSLKAPRWSHATQLVSNGDGTRLAILATGCNEIWLLDRKAEALSGHAAAVSFEPTGRVSFGPGPSDPALVGLSVSGTREDPLLVALTARPGREEVRTSVSIQSRRWDQVRVATGALPTVTEKDDAVEIGFPATLRAQLQADFLQVDGNRWLVVSHPGQGRIWVIKNGTLVKSWNWLDELPAQERKRHVKPNVESPNPVIGTRESTHAEAGASTENSSQRHLRPLASVRWLVPGISFPAQNSPSP